MTKRVGQTPLYDLLASSIRDDPTIKAAAEALDPSRFTLARAIPDFLIWARLDPAFAATRRLAPPLQRLADLAGGLKPLSEAELELLAWQLHVDFREVAKTPEQLARMILSSIPWHRKKGTPASLKAALALFGLQAEIEEDGEGDYWYTYQIGLPEIADEETVKLVCRVAHEMQPARCRLYRIYTGVWDVRPATYSNGRYSEAAYSFFSGVSSPGLPDGGDLIVSFGRKRLAKSRPLLSVLHVGRDRQRAVTDMLADDMQYSTARYSESILPANHGFVRSRLNSIVIGRPEYLPQFWDGEWDERKWVDMTHISYAREPFTFGRQRITRIEAVYSDSVYGDLNAHYSQPVFTLVDDPPAYSDSAYSEHDPKRRVYVVDEIFLAERLAQARGPLLPESARVAFAHARFGEHRAVTAPLLPTTGWDGAWDARGWRAGGAFSRLTREVSPTAWWNGSWDDRAWLGTFPN